jgi:hypothetical protein
MYFDFVERRDLPPLVDRRGIMEHTLNRSLQPASERYKGICIGRVSALHPRQRRRTDTRFLGGGLQILVSGHAALYQGS